MGDIGGSVNVIIRLDRMIQNLDCPIKSGNDKKAGGFQGVAINIMNRKETGAIAENIAADYLLKHGYKIRERNYRTRAGEIDIIAEKHRTLIFIEVRAKTGRAFGSAEESITERKKKRLIALAEAYLGDTGEQPDSCRIDIIAIKLNADGTPIRLNVIENATGWTTD